MEDRGGSTGLGLGLYIAQQIAIAHGGLITVRSSASEGTTFEVELCREPPARRTSSGSGPEFTMEIDV